MSKQGESFWRRFNPPWSQLPTGHVASHGDGLDGILPVAGWPVHCPPESPSIRIAVTKLRRMRLNDPANRAISSLPRIGSSGISNWPRLILSAISDNRATGRAIVK